MSRVPAVVMSLAGIWRMARHMRAAAERSPTPPPAPVAQAEPATAEGVGAPVPAAAPTGARAALGRLLRDRGGLSEPDLQAALRVQRRTGGLLGEILLAQGTCSPETVSGLLGEQLGVLALDGSERALPLLGRDDARALHAVVLDDADGEDGGAVVAVSDHSPATVAALAQRLGRPVQVKIGDRATIDGLLAEAYGRADADRTTTQLWDRTPDLSAFRTQLSGPQLALVGFLLAGTLIGLLIDPILTGAAWVGLCTVVFGVVTVVRLRLAWLGWRGGPAYRPTAEQLAAMDERELPVYTMLIPLYREKRSTIHELLGALGRIDYPAHKLDGVLLVEADDDATRAAIRAEGVPHWLRMVTVPDGQPRTKPRAMLYGLEYARGELLTVFDAEDHPEPLQLKKAAWVFAGADPSLACLQAALAYHNPRQNLLTRWFALEYDAWFTLFLPGLHVTGAPIPLGGTSNHFRTEALRRCAGWDPFNVTEDADLGLRLSRLGYRTAMLDTVTWEEANSRPANWLRQRSRWIKGYMQTTLVHTRHPRTLVRELGLRNAAMFLFTVGGSVANALLFPVFLSLLAVWTFAHPAWLEAILPAPVYYPSLVLLVLGNFFLVLVSVATAVAHDHDDLVPAALLLPVYWLLASVAAYIALVELVARPHHWHKTEHGLHLVEDPA